MNPLSPSLSYLARAGVPPVAPTFGTALDKLAPTDERSKVMFVLAHPDDEVLVSGAALQLKENGFNVQFVYLTDGDAGRDVTRLNRTGKTLANARREENREALETLQIDTPPVYFHLPDGRLSAFRDRARHCLTELIQQENPAAVFTFGPDGITDHGDHKAACAITDQAVDASGRDSRLYHAVISKKGLAAFKRAFGDPLPGGWANMQSVPNDVVTDRVKLSQQNLLLKLMSATRHASQFPPSDLHGFQKYFSKFRKEEYIRQR